MSDTPNSDTPARARREISNHRSTSGHHVGKGDRVYLIDGSGYIFRAFHALPPLSRPSDGLPVGAVHGFCQMLWKLLRDSKESDKPTHLAVIFDAARETFRNDIYPQYKAQRPPAPEELVPQFPLIRDAVKAFNVASIEQDRFEADDLIATYAKQAVEVGAEVLIVSSDKDLMQLIKPGISLLDTMKNKRIGEPEVLEKFGVKPDKVVDVQSLAGDSVDNVPGVPGIGVKTGAELINQYGDLDTLLARAGEIKQPKRREKLIEFAEQARMSRELVRLKDDVPVEVTLDETGVREPDHDALMAFMRTMEFNTLTKRIAEAFGVAAPPPLAISVGSSLKPKPVDGGNETAAKSMANGATGPAATAAWWLPRRVKCRSTGRNTKPSPPSSSSPPGSTKRWRSATSRSTPRPIVLTPCRRTSSVSRSPPLPARPATCRCNTRPATALISAAPPGRSSRCRCVPRSTC